MENLELFVKKELCKTLSIEKQNIKLEFINCIGYSVETLTELISIIREMEFDKLKAYNTDSTNMDSLIIYKAFQKDSIFYIIVIDTFEFYQPTLISNIFQLKSNSIFELNL